MGAILPVVAQLVELGLELTPTIIGAVNTVMALSGSGNPPTPEQQAQIDAALDEAHAALQAAQQAG